MNRGTANTVQGKEGIRTGSQTRATRGGLVDRQPQRGNVTTPSKDRLSVDPLRATDRYRLVLPIDDRM
ncbi:MAG: hypothetical protein R3F29_12105 [Planctomycetota bacterium]